MPFKCVFIFGMCGRDEWQVFAWQVTLPGEGRDRVFKVAMKWLAQVNLYTLEEALEGRTRTIPYDAIQVSY